MPDPERVLLIRPPSVTRGKSFIASQLPLNIASIAASLIRTGREVRILDFDVEAYDEDALKKAVLAFSPFMVGISCYTPTVVGAHRIAAFVKKCLPDTVVATGGPHISALPRDTMDEFPYFDVGVIGEGEESIVELADSISGKGDFEGIPGIIFRKGGAVVLTGRRPPIKDLDSLTHPARQLLNIPLYKGMSHRGFSRASLRITEIMTSRGCPNRCIFCASDVVMGKGVRFRSPDSVKAEIGECVEKYYFNHFTISDDTFTLREDRLYEICREFAGRRVTWNCNARVWPISRKVLSVMAQSGCRGISFGVESGSPRILNLIKKNVTVEQIEDAFRWSRESGIKLVEANVIIGSHPSETTADLEMTGRLLKRLRPDVIMASVLVPYPGTEIYQLMKEKDLIFEDKKWDNFVLFGKEPSWRTENFDSKQLLKIQKRMLLGFYFNPFYMFRMLRKIDSVKSLIYWFRGGIGFLVSCIKRERDV